MLWKLLRKSGLLLLNSAQNREGVALQGITDSYPHWTLIKASSPVTCISTSFEGVATHYKAHSEFQGQYEVRRHTCWQGWMEMKKPKGKNE